MVKLWLAVAVVVCGLSMSALAQSPPSNTNSHAAPGPVIGAGLPALLLIGGVWAVRRMRRRKP